MGSEVSMSVDAFKNVLQQMAYRDDPRKAALLHTAVLSAFDLAHTGR